jgi:hypothetical protein
MTIDTVNTDIFDDDKITGILCVWFVGEKLERVRFDHRAIEPARKQETSLRDKEANLGEAAGYKVVLDEVVAAMNVSTDVGKVAPEPVGRIGVNITTKKKRITRTAEKMIGAP